MALLNSEYPQEKNNSNAIVLKDPRVSLFLPEYKNTISKSKRFAQIKAILCVRSPVEVAASLYERDKLDQQTSQMVWLVYILYAERASRNIKRIIFNHADLFSEQPYESFLSKTDSLNIEWSADNDTARKAIEDFITPRLYRQRAEAINISKIPIVETVYQALLDMGNGKNEEDSIRILDKCFDIISPILSVGTIMRQSLQDELVDTKNTLSIIEQEKAIARANLEDFRKQFKKLQNILETRTSESTKNLSSMIEAVEKKSSDLVLASHKILILEQSEANLKHSIGDIQSQMEQFKKHKNTELRQKLTEIEEVRHSEAKLKHSLTDIKSQMSLLQVSKGTELKRLRAELAQAVQSEAKLEHALADIKSQMSLVQEIRKDEFLRLGHELEQAVESEARLMHALADIKSQMQLLERNKNIELQNKQVEFNNELSRIEKSHIALTSEMQNKLDVYKKEREEFVINKDILSNQLDTQNMQILWLEEERDCVEKLCAAQSEELGELHQKLMNEKEKFSQQALLLSETRAFANEQHALSDQLNQALAISLTTIDGMQQSLFWRLKNIFELTRGYPKKLLRKRPYQKLTNLEVNNEVENAPSVESVRQWLIDNEGSNWTEDNDKECRANVDNISLSKGIMHVWGWAFHSVAETTQVDVLSLGWNGHVDVFTAESRKAREDVQAVFGGTNSRMSGFSFLGSWGKEFKEIPREIAIVLRLRGVRDQFVSVKRSEGDADSRIDNTYEELTTQTGWQLNRVLSHVRRGDFQSLVQGGRRVMNRRIGGSEKKDDNREVLTRTLKVLKNDGQFIIDHSLGGGCNSYTRDLTEKVFGEGRRVIILSFSVQTLSPTIQILSKNKKDYSYVIPDGISFLQELAPELESIFLNNIVSFPNPEFFISNLSQIVENNNISLTIAFHDQYAICPSHFLLNSEGRFCNIPKLDVCASCLHRNSFGFTSLAESSDVEVWRQKWRKLISVAEHLLFFSEASLALVRKAHPDMPQNTIEVKPHTIDVSDWDTPIVPVSKPLKLGVVGSLSHHKGSEVMMDLADEIQKRGLDIEIHIIGELNAETHSVITTTGPFNRHDLPTLVKASGVNVFLMPSVVPETFSYVTAELMAIGFPVVSFDFGAPAERLKKYKLGLTIPQGTSAEILDSLIAFHAKLQKR